MVLVIVWVLAIMALFALVIAWGVTIDGASRLYARSGQPSSIAPRHMASPASR
jgi:hypothetical protein